MPRWYALHSASDTSRIAVDVGYDFLLRGLVAIDGRLVLVGGEDQSNWEDGGGWVTPSAWSFNPRTNRWTRLPNMHFERRGSGVAATEGRIYALGGSYCPGLKPNGPVGTHTVESLPISAVNRAEAD